mgnify:FL=1
MKKKFLLLFLGVFGCTFCLQVSAQEVFFQNDNGVILTYEEYEFFSKMYWDGYQENVTFEELAKIKNLNLIHASIESKSVLSDYLTRSSSIESNLRRLTITKACTSQCLVTLKNEWLGTPFVKSYDLMGVRLDNVSIKNTGNLIVSGNGNNQSYVNPKVLANGFAYSFVLPNANNLIATMTFYTDLGGTIYGSYQHAISNTTQFVSTQYTIGAGGFGNVFLFYGNARNVYDGMNGVDIAV